MIPLVLLPGMMCDARLFAPQIAALSAGRTIVCADLSGADDMTGLALSVLADAPPRFALAGLSMGGIVAMEILRIAPERVARIALIATNPLAEAPSVRDARAAQIARAETDLAGLMDEVFIPRYFQRPDSAAQTLCRDMALSLGSAVFARQSRALRDRPDQTATLAGVRCPALILHGDHDRLCPPERHELMHRLLPQATRVTLADIGHLPTLEAAQQTTEGLRRWLD